MMPFGYTRPADVASAVALLAARPGAQPLAGGTNLVDLMKLGVERPALLVDIARLPLDRIDGTPAGGLRIGATVRNSDLAAHPLVRTRYPLVAQAVLAGASGQLRNVATTGGNLLQRTRCLYFQDVSKPCNKRRPGTGCPARTGVHRDLGVLGTSDHCVATHPSDLAVALVALNATVRLTGPDGDRVFPLAAFHRLPGDSPERDTELGPAELVTAVELPPPPAGARSVYRKVRDRASFAFATCSLAALLTLRDGRVDTVRLAFGALAPRPWRALTAEAALYGQPPTPEVIGRALEAELTAARPLPDNAFKLTLARRLAVRELVRLAETQEDR
ncbi:xanthine dehydrogenase family protein subunit M [Kitasatospora sp. NPDC047058]|uniref:FAD binding domain-containing protein n=1 Tax=Kitasatospora sp. NPDC047058 TaxID=3155620 RepID=UPI0033D89DFB